MEKRAENMVEQYGSVIDMIFKDAEKNKIPFFGFCYVRANDSIENIDFYHRLSAVNLYTWDEYVISKLIMEGYFSQAGSELE